MNTKIVSIGIGLLALALTVPAVMAATTSAPALPAVAGNADALIIYCSSGGHYDANGKLTSCDGASIVV